MNTALVVADNFSPHADTIRRLALGGSFEELQFAGHNYPGIQQNIEAEKMLHDLLCPRIANLVGFNIVPVLSFFRLGLRDHNPDIYIHADNAIGHGVWASVYYLSRPEDCVGGTAFWTHKRLGWDRLPTPEAIKSIGTEFDQEFCDKLNADGRHENRWTMNGLVAMKYNRIAIYPGDLFHSRYPQHYSGEQNDSGRLVWVCFFRPQK